MGVHWSADCALLSRSCIVTSTVIKKNRQVGLLKQEAIGIIFNWEFCNAPLNSIPLLPRL